MDRNNYQRNNLERPPHPETFTINDTNIHELVRQYLNKEQLPAELENKPIGKWDVKYVTNMEGLFTNASNFNEPLNNWKVSSVTNMKNMFKGCTIFNQYLNSWKVGNVEDMSAMFFGCTNFDQPLNNWVVRNVRDMKAMFYNCKHLNQSFISWNNSLQNLNDIRYMFAGCERFNNALFNLSRLPEITSMLGVFQGCSMLNHPSLTSIDLEEITNMRDMFKECLSLNQPLNGLNVSNATNMQGMFEGCIVFNQPLNRWDVSNVTNMNRMFANCEMFNQNISNWDVDNVITADDIFIGCNRLNFIYHPDLPEDDDEEDDDEEDDDEEDEEEESVDAMQIHKESGKINYTKLIDFLHEKIGISPPNSINYPTYINENMTNMINESDETEQEKAQQRNGLQRIMTERLNDLNYSEKSPLILNSIFYTIEYVKLQSNEFKTIYVSTFVAECVTAYNGEDGMTCALGALERIVISLLNACQSILSSGKENADYEQIVAIIAANPEKLIPEYIRDWYKIHKTGTAEAFPAGTTVEQKKADLKRYLLDNFPDSGELINAKIAEIADNIGYDDDDFMYGGLLFRNSSTFKKSGAKRKTKYTFKKSGAKKSTFKKSGAKRKTKSTFKKRAAKRKTKKSTFKKRAVKRNKK
jgi:surface protein